MVREEYGALFVAAREKQAMNEIEHLVMNVLIVADRDLLVLWNVEDAEVVERKTNIIDCYSE